MLAWTRTALALVGNGVLVVVRHPHALPMGPAAGLAAGAGLVAAVCLVAGRVRALAMSGSRVPGPDQLLVVCLGVGVGLLCVATAAVVVLTA